MSKVLYSRIKRLDIYLLKCMQLAVQSGKNLKYGADDIKMYRYMIDTLPHREKMCGFLSGIYSLHLSIYIDCFIVFFFFYKFIYTLSKVV